MAWLNLTMPNQTIKNGLKAKKIKLPQMNFFLKKLLNFYVPISPFHSAKFLKSFRVMKMCHFWTQNGPFVLNNIFWYKPLLLLWSTYWPFSLSKIKKKSYHGSRVMRIHNFWAHNGPFPQMRMTILFIIYAYRHAKDQSQILIY